MQDERWVGQCSRLHCGITRYFKTATAEGFGDQQFAAIYESIKNHSGSGSHVSTS